MVLYIIEEQRKGRHSERREQNLRKQAKIIDLFCIYYTRYMEKKGVSDVYLPTAEEIYLIRNVSRLHYTIPQWEKFIRTYFRFADYLVAEYGGEVSIKHFLEHFNKISHYCADDEE